MNSPLLSKKAQKTREHVLNVSLELMKKNGYQNTTVRDTLVFPNQFKGEKKV